MNVGKTVRRPIHCLFFGSSEAKSFQHSYMDIDKCIFYAKVYMLLHESRSLNVCGKQIKGRTEINDKIET